MIQLSLDFDKKTSENCSITKSVSEHQTQALIRFLEQPVNSNGCINVYKPGNRKSQYFRYSIRIGNQVKHHHICGGNIYCQLAQNRAIQIKELIDKGISYYQIIEVIKKL